MVAAVNCFSSASLYWACHARVATEQEVIKRNAVECQAGALEKEWVKEKRLLGGPRMILERWKKKKDLGKGNFSPPPV